MSNLVKPFSGSPPPEIPLPRAPLVRVIGQVMFSPVLGLAAPTTLAPFQERIRATYPFMDRETVQHIAFGQDGVPMLQQGIIWRFRNADQSWRLSVTPTFIALETETYTSRTDFLGRLSAVIQALEHTTLKPELTQRVGIRYVSRLEGEALTKLSTFIKPEFVGPIDTAMGHAVHLLSESLIEIEEGMMTARWGKLPPNATIDPQAYVPIPSVSWFHDLDLFKDTQMAFSDATLAPLLEALAKRQYAVFRFMVTDAYLRHFGGKI
jgi:uncharacterized protein (TIGR04255 family)